MEGAMGDRAGGGKLPRDRWVRRLYLPTYTVSDAARLAQIHRGTVSAWHYGYPSAHSGRTPRVLSDREPGVPLSYLQLVEVAFVATLRKLGVSLRKIRIARDYLATRVRAQYPFAQLELKTDGTEILKDLGDSETSLVNALLVPSAHGQLIWADPIRDRIREFDYDEIRRLAVRWFPRGRSTPVVIDPQIAFGTPILEDSKLPTWVVGERLRAGESIEEIGDDFGISEVAIRHAIEFEGMRGAALAL